MKKLPPVALVCAGRVSRSGLDRLPGVREHLRWIKSGTVSAASRVANTLGSGAAARGYDELAGAAIVLLKAPDDKVRPLLHELAGAGLDWRRRTLILIDCRADSLASPDLERLGAWVASVNQVEIPRSTLLVEGHPCAVRIVKQMARSGPAPLIELRRGCKQEYLEGLRLATSAFLPIVASAVDRFCNAGMDKAAAEKTAALLFEGSVRAYCRAGKRLLTHLRRVR